jgi:hypothetical protein
MRTTLILSIVFALTFVLLAGWMDWGSALLITVVDWVLGVLVFWWIKPEAEVPQHIPSEIQFPSTPSRSEHSRLAA